MHSIIEEAWKSPFKVDEASVLRQTMEARSDRQIYPRQTLLINSSGMGKSRMVEELSTETFTVPICLRNRTKGEDYMTLPLTADSGYEKDIHQEMGL